MRSKFGRFRRKEETKLDVLVSSKYNTEDVLDFPERLLKLLDPRHHPYQLSIMGRTVSWFSKPSNELVESMEVHHKGCYEQNVEAIHQLRKQVEARSSLTRKMRRLLLHERTKPIELVIVVSDSTGMGIGCASFEEGLGGRIARDVFDDRPTILVGGSSAKIEHISEMLERARRILTELSINSEDVEIDFVVSIGGNDVGAIANLDAVQTLASRGEEVVSSKNYEGELAKAAQKRFLSSCQTLQEHPKNTLEEWRNSLIALNEFPGCKEVRVVGMPEELSRLGKGFNEITKAHAKIIGEWAIIFNSVDGFHRTEADVECVVQEFERDVKGFSTIRLPFVSEIAEVNATIPAKLFHPEYGESPWIKITKQLETLAHLGEANGSLQSVFRDLFSESLPGQVASSVANKIADSGQVSRQAKRQISKAFM